MRLVLGLLFLLTTLIIIIIIRTLCFKSRPKSITPIEKPELDNDILEHLSEVLKCKTLSYVDTLETMEFEKLHNCLEKFFPHIHKKLSKEVIGEYGLIYTWKGSSEEGKSVLLMAHQDVVPIENGTEKDWTYPPFSGEIADGYIWGRGSLDTKGTLMGIMESIEWLLSQNYTPKNTWYVAFGSDEEINGKRGAKAIVSHLTSQGVHLESVLDEGGNVYTGVVPGVSKPVALIGTGEKGYMSVDIIASSTGGHASMPPRQTASGILARAIQRIEGHPFPAKLGGVTEEFFLTVASEMKFGLRLVIANIWLFRPILKRLLAQSASTNAAIRTTAAVTMLEGSPADNVLPQQAKATVNLRIYPGENIEQTKAYLEKVINDKRITVTIKNECSLANPAVVSSTNSKYYKALSKSISEIFPKAAISPFLMVGITDSRHYADITNSIYRFNPLNLEDQDLKRIHGTNERISIENYKDMVQFYIRFIKNCDE